MRRSSCFPITVALLSWLLALPMLRWAVAQEFPDSEPEPEFALQEGQADEALELALQRFERGVDARRKGQLTQAVELLGSSLAIRQQWLPKSLEVAEALNALGSVYNRLGELDLAADFFQRGLAIRERLAPGGLDVAASLNNLGVVAINRGDLGQAQAFHRRALEIKEKEAPGSLTMAASLTNLGMVALLGGDLDLAERHLRRALAIKDELSPNSATVAASLGGLGHLAMERGDLERAEIYLQRALAIHRDLHPQSFHVAYELARLADVARQRGNLEKARTLALQALEIQRQVAPDSLAMADTHKILGLVALDDGELAGARESCLAALEIGERLAPDGLSAAEILNILGRIARRGGDLQLAAGYFERSLERFESRVGRLAGSHDARGGFRAHYRHFYRDAIEVLLELDRVAEAFAVLERSRTRSFLAMLAERELLFTADVPSDLERERRTVSRLYDQTQGQIFRLSPAVDGSEIDRLRGELADLQRRRDDIVARIRRASPRFAELRYPQPVDSRAAAAALDPGTVMLSYSVGKERIDLFTVSREGGLAVHSLAIGESDLRREVELFREQIQEARGPSTAEVGPRDFLDNAGLRLFRLLIEPAVDRIAASDRVLIVPDGPLHLFPFAALRREIAGDEGSPSKARQYFVEWKALHTIQSATVYARQISARPRSPRQGLRLAAFGDPEYGSRREVEPSGDSPWRALLDRGLEPVPLPSSRLEVEQIADLFPPETTVLHVGEAATEERAKTIGLGVRYLHFATHGFLDTRLPLNSGLVFSRPGEGQKGDDNGLLQAWEIFESMRLDADLVVLSACGSSLGREQGGEGLISLTRAFQYAGARSVTATLWNVEDRATAELMVRFYRYLTGGLSKDAALRAAQVELMTEPLPVMGEGGASGGGDETTTLDYSAPYYWAAFQLTGDWQ